MGMMMYFRSWSSGASLGIVYLLLLLVLVLVLSLMVFMLYS